MKKVNTETIERIINGIKTIPILATFFLLNKVEIPYAARMHKDKFTNTKILVVEDAEIAGIGELKIALAMGVGSVIKRTNTIRVKKYLTSIFPQY